MFTEVKNYGKIGYSNETLSSLINMPESTIRKCNTELIRGEYLTIVANQSIDPITKCHTDTKIYDENKLKQAIIWTLKEHHDKIIQQEAHMENTDKRVENLEKTVASQNKQIAAQQKMIEALLRDKNQEIPKYANEFNF